MPADGQVGSKYAARIARNSMHSFYFPIIKHTRWKRCTGYHLTADQSYAAYYFLLCTLKLSMP